MRKLISGHVSEHVAAESSTTLELFMIFGDSERNVN